MSLLIKVNKCTLSFTRTALFNFLISRARRHPHNLKLVAKLRYIYDIFIFNGLSVIFFRNTHKIFCNHVLKKLFWSHFYSFHLQALEIYILKGIALNF